jgi:hypothetical protein
MTSFGSRLARGVPAGILATVTMDAAMLAAARLGGERWSSSRLDLDVVGRWGMGLVRGRLRHGEASLEAGRTADVVAGLATHYATGVALTEAFILAPWRPGGLCPAAVAYGVATAVFPLFVLFPSLGYGILGLRSGEAARMARIMLLGHVAFGIGIGLGSAILVGEAAGGADVAPTGPTTSTGSA